MQVESTTLSQRIQAEFWNFADAVRNSGRSVEDSFLGAFTAVLASREIENLNVDFTSTNDFNAIPGAVYKLFDKLFLTTHVNILDILNINFEHPALHRLLYVCNNAELSNSVLIELLDWIIGHASINFSESLTPPEVAELIINIANIKEEESVLDPAMGVAGFYRALRSRGNLGSGFTGVEINVKSFYISSLYKYLLSDSNSTLLQCSTFSTHIKPVVNSVDVVLCNPPVRRIPLSEARYRYQERLCSEYISSEMSLNFVELGLQAIKPGGRAIFLINMKPLFGAGELQQIRRHWVESGILKTVISLPSKLLANTGLKCAILIFEKSTDASAESEKKIKFVKSDDCFSEGKKGKRFLNVENIKEITNRINYVDDGLVAKIVGLGSVKDNDYSLVPDQYIDQEIAGVNLSLSKIWEPLGEVAEILRGGSFSNLDNGSEPVIQGRDLRVEKLNINELECKNLAAFKKPVRRTQAYDILLQRIGENPAAYFVTTEEGLAVADTVFILRFSRLEPEIINFICQFINSEEGSRRIRDSNSYAVVQTQSIKAIKGLKVPVPDRKVVTLVKEMNEIEAALRNEYEKAAQLRVSLFGGFDEVDLSTNLRKVKLSSQVLKNALSQKDDINYKVRSLYPFPLAYPFRNIYVEKEYAAIYERQMKYGEHLLSFLASVGLSLIYAYKEQINESLSDIETLITDGLSAGLSPGHWRQLLQKTCSILRSLEDAPLADDFSALWFKGRGKKESDFAVNTNTYIVQKLNNFKHGRGPVNTHEYKEFGEEQAIFLNKILEDVEFLSQCEIVLIDSIDTEWATRNTRYKASLLRGDHPAFERVVFDSDERLSRDKLYIRHNDRFISLYPFLSCIYNPKTKKVEIFSFDKRIKDSLMLKSFDSGTSIESREVDTDLRFWIKMIGNSVG